MSQLRPVEFHTKSDYGEHVWCRISDLIIGVCYSSANKIVVGQNNCNTQCLTMYCATLQTDIHTLIMGDFQLLISTGTPVQVLLIRKRGILSITHAACVTSYPWGSCVRLISVYSIRELPGE